MKPGAIRTLTSVGQCMTRDERHGQPDGSVSRRLQRRIEGPAEDRAGAAQRITSSSLGGRTVWAAMLATVRVLRHPS